VIFDWSGVSIADYGREWPWMADLALAKGRTKGGFAWIWLKGGQQPLFSVFFSRLALILNFFFALLLHRLSSFI